LRPDWGEEIDNQLPKELAPKDGPQTFQALIDALRNEIRSRQGSPVYWQRRDRTCRDHAGHHPAVALCAGDRSAGGRVGSDVSHHASNRT
jgi:hypothetical protein